MPRLFVYRIKTDLGTAPHISDGYLTLTICKSDIRKEAKDGDYVLAVVARTSNAMKTLKKTLPKKDIPFLAAYLFRVGDVVPMHKYDEWCTKYAPKKLCTNDYFEGNAQYNKNLKWRPGPHSKSFRDNNISGCNSLVSTHFAAWTSTSPHRLTEEEIIGLGMTEDDIVKRGIGHKIVHLANTDMVEKLIASKKVSPNNNSKSAKNKTLKKNNKPNKPTGKEGYTLF